jgi:hypothetical protein
MAIGGFNQKWKEGLLQATSGTSLAGTLKAVLLDADAVGAAVTGATNATPIVVTSASHGLANGDLVALVSIGGNANANGVFRVANVATNTFELTDPDTGANIAGSGAYTSGGRMLPWGTWDFYDDCNAGAVAVSAALTTKTYTKGVIDFDDPSFTGVSGSVSECLIFILDTGTASTSRLVYILTTATGLPFTPNGGNLTVAINASGLARI